ncbi:MAG: site-2 protease family protein [bacterium]
MNIESILLQILVVLFSVICHEVFHGWVALKCGDDTALRMGRITLNPFSHLDFMGSIVLPTFAILAKVPVIGWAKPVPINPMNFRNPKRDTLLVAVAGPAANLALALLGGALLRIISFIEASSLFNIELIKTVLTFLVVINVILAVFNLLPIPPLDGSKVVIYFLPKKLAYQYERIGVFGIFIVLFLLFTGVLGWFVWPIVMKIVSFLI